MTVLVMALAVLMIYVGVVGVVRILLICAFINDFNMI